MIFHRARFTAELEGEDLIVVVDLNLPDTKSVTNDAERVVATIAEYVTIGERLIVYRDSEGWWDGMIVERERFVRFFPIREQERAKAIAAVRNGTSKNPSRLPWRKGPRRH